MIVREDLQNLFIYLTNFAVQVVKHDYKTKFPIKYLDQKMKITQKKLEFCHFVNCEHPKNKSLTPSFIENTQGSFLHRFSWLNNDEIGEIPKKWNHLVKEYPHNNNSSLLHYTVGAPCFHDYRDGVEAKIWDNYYNNSQQGFDVPKGLKVNQ